MCTIRASCLVNPRACYETTLKLLPVSSDKKMKIAVVGAGPSGLACATTAAQRGHQVTLFEKDAVIGGQFNMAKRVPGKEEFHETLRYFKRQIDLLGVDLRVNTTATLTELKAFDAIVFCTGVLPRQVTIPQSESSKSKINVVSYLDVLKHGAAVGPRVAVIGAGGIGFDVADFLTHPHDDSHATTAATATASENNHHYAQAPLPVVDQAAVTSFLNSWLIDTSVAGGGLLDKDGAKKAMSSQPKVPRKVYLLQRKEGKLGAGLGKTTGWIHRTTLKKREVEELAGCRYVEINDHGLVIEQKVKPASKDKAATSSTSSSSSSSKSDSDEKSEKKVTVTRTLEVDTVVVCAGQESHRALHSECRKELVETLKKKVFMIGGAHEVCTCECVCVLYRYYSISTTFILFLVF